MDNNFLQDYDTNTRYDDATNANTTDGTPKTEIQDAMHVQDGDILAKASEELTESLASMLKDIPSEEIRNQHIAELTEWLKKYPDIGIANAIGAGEDLFNQAPGNGPVPRP